MPAEDALPGCIAGCLSPVLSRKTCAAGAVTHAAALFNRAKERFFFYNI
jgi:hypothetical protein